MSMFIHKDGEFISFREYVMLAETFTPKKSNYGNNIPDFDNGNISTNGNNIWTWIKTDSGVYILLTLVGNSNKEYEVGFAVSTEPSVDFDDYTDDRVGLGKALTTFNSVFFVLLEIIKKHKSKIKILSFEGADSKLDKFYSIMIKNKTFIKMLEQSGFIYTGYNSNKYNFASIE